VADPSLIPPPAAGFGLWHLVTGSYPPEPGGVADYTAAVARAMADSGAEVHVWCRGDSIGPVTEPCGVNVHRIAGRFGPAGLARLDRKLDRFPGPRTILVQYVPHAFGWKAMNLPFAAWVAWRARLGDEVRVMFHEVAVPWVGQPLRYNLIAAVNRVMAAVLIRSCTIAYLSIPSWAGILHRLGGRRVPMVWTPVPATVPTDPPAQRVAKARARLTDGNPAVKVIGHFGTYGPLITSILAPALSAILNSRPDARVVLLGSGGERWRDEFIAARLDWSNRVVAPGPLPALAVAEYLLTCDLMIQPYPDGVSTRRTTLMASLANGVPVLTTLGPLSETVWEDGSVATASAEHLAEAAVELLDRPAVLGELGRAGQRLYDARFAVERTVDVLLRETPCSAVASPGILP
jgi:glycosyltransferase involved in cell wall biosynthesis